MPVHRPKDKHTEKRQRQRESEMQKQREQERQQQEGRAALKDALATYHRVRNILSRLPPELCREIYGYTLVCSTELIIVDNRNDRFIYMASIQGKSTEDKDLDRAVEFFVGTCPVSESKDVHSSILSHNVLSITSKYRLTPFMKLVNALSNINDLPRAQTASETDSHSKFEEPVLLHGLRIDTDADPTSDDIAGPNSDEGFDTSPLSDFQKGDCRLPGLRAFRILQPLMTLKRLQNIHIHLDQNVSEWTFGQAVFEGVGKENAGIPLVAAVIARLKELVLSSSKAPRFEVSLTIKGELLDDPPTTNNGDVSWLWDAPAEGELQRMKGYLEHRQKVDDFRLHYLKMEYASLKGLKGSSDFYDDPYDDFFDKAQLRSFVTQSQKLQEIRAQLEGLEIRQKPPEQDLALLERCYVSQVAADPEWEKKVEAMVKFKSFNTLCASLKEEGAY